MKNVHVPVLLKEVISYLNPKPGQNFIDGTLGGGGYTSELLKRGAKVLAIDLDEKAIDDFKRNKEIKKYKDNLILVHGNFADLKQICHERRFYKINGIVLDLGLSSNQLEDKERGFSFTSEGPLDMRFDPVGNPLTAFEIINNYTVKELSEIFRTFGEEKKAFAISKIIREIRLKTKISSPQRLAEIVSSVYQKHFKKPSKIHPATKVFQALRIFINHELENLEKFLPQALETLEPQGRLAVVSFHSLEDRIVKDFFRNESRSCICPPESLICNCHHQALVKILTKKPIAASPLEIKNNLRSRSAKLRVAEKL
jgi:16S rRNA (cytosine1402-N4)-methyltransferase